MHKTDCYERDSASYPPHSPSQAEVRGVYEAWGISGFGDPRLCIRGNRILLQCAELVLAELGAHGLVVVVLQEVEAPAIIPHIAEAGHHKYPYEALFRSLHKLLMDTATSE